MLKKNVKFCILHCEKICQKNKTTKIFVKRKGQKVNNNNSKEIIILIVMWCSYRYTIIHFQLSVFYFVSFQNETHCFWIPVLDSLSHLFIFIVHCNMPAIKHLFISYKKSVTHLYCCTIYFEYFLQLILFGLFNTFNILHLCALTLLVLSGTFQTIVLRLVTHQRRISSDSLSV